MDGATQAAWAQAILSGAGIFFSGAFAVLVPRWERKAREAEQNRRRLNITTLWAPPSGLRVEIQYLPEFTHVGLKARVRLGDPNGKALHYMRLISNPAPIDGKYIRPVADGLAVEGVATVPLVRLDNEEPFTGSVLVLPPLDSPNTPESIIKKATLIFEIVTDAGDLLLKDTPLVVSAIDEQNALWQLS